MLRNYSGLMYFLSFLIAKSLGYDSSNTNVQNMPTKKLTITANIVVSLKLSQVFVTISWSLFTELVSYLLVILRGIIITDFSIAPSISKRFTTTVANPLTFGTAKS